MQRTGKPGRPAKKKLIVKPGWFHEQKKRFIETAFHHYQQVFISLRDDVLRDKKFTVRKWAEQFDLGDTWIERWAADTVSLWEWHPESLESSEDPEGKYVRMVWAEPRDKPPDVLFNIPLRMPNAADRAEFLKALYADLESVVLGSPDKTLSAWLDGMLKNGQLLEIDEPTNLNLKIECAVLYYFGRMSTQDIANRVGVGVVPGSTMTAGVRESVNRWLKEISNILELPLRRRGRRLRR